MRMSKGDSRSPPAHIEGSSPFLCVGRLSPEKGGVLLAATAADLDCDLVFVKAGVSRSAAEMEKKGRDLPVGFRDRKY